MSQDFSNLPEEEQLRAENDFLKMKLMLQHGAQFENTEKSDLPPEIENDFLNNVLEFEKQFAEKKMITVFEKVGKPTRFLPVSTIADSKIKETWLELLEYLNEHGIDLHVCSPNVSERELYRFTLEELFNHETDDMNIPGMTTVFVYDEFYPDPLYEAEHQVQRLFEDIFCLRPADVYFWGLDDNGLTINNKFYKNAAAAKAVFNQFKSCFDDIGLDHVTIIKRELLKGSYVKVQGNYRAVGKSGTIADMIFEGDFEIIEVPDDMRCWNAKEIKITGIEFDGR